jgi:putative FmdB family regulatory protein
MPLYEYACSACDRRFETLVMGKDDGAEVHCPGCASARVERLLSVFATPSSATSSSPGTPMPAGACGRCGDPRGPGACGAN